MAFKVLAGPGVFGFCCLGVFGFTGLCCLTFRALAGRVVFGLSGLGVFGFTELGCLTLKFLAVPRVCGFCGHVVKLFGPERSCWLWGLEAK